jgi:hypothetical protein
VAPGLTIKNLNHQGHGTPSGRTESFPESFPVNFPVSFPERIYENGEICGELPYLKPN